MFPQLVPQGQPVLQRLPACGASRLFAHCVPFSNAQTRMDGAQAGVRFAGIG
jgi:hypothetical protein